MTDILYVEPVTCCRLVKEAQALYDTGKYELTLATLEGPLERYRGWGLQPFEFIVRLGEWDRKKDILNRSCNCWFKVLGSLVRETRHWDLISCHNAPDIFTAYCAVNSRAPVVHNCHDITTLFPAIGKVSQVRQDEQIALSLTQGQVFVSESQRKYCQNAYSLDLPNSIVYPCYSTQDYIPEEPKPRLFELTGERHVGYEGGVAINQHEEGHRYYWPLWKKLCDQGVHVHVHTAVSFPENLLPSESWSAKTRKYFHWHPTMSPPLMIKAMSAYDANIVGFHGNTPFTDMAMPNKLFESMSAGLPQICTDHYEIRNYVEEHEIGHMIDYLNPEIDWEYLDECRKRVDKLKFKETHEGHIHEIEELYDRALEIGKP